MLEHTQFSLYEIAYKTGFSDHSHFSREFRSQFGASPRMLRDRMQEGWPRPEKENPSK